jgi:hypothetical protein
MEWEEVLAERNSRPAAMFSKLEVRQTFFAGAGKLSEALGSNLLKATRRKGATLFKSEHPDRLIEVFGSLVTAEPPAMAPVAVAVVIIVVVVIVVVGPVEERRKGDESTMMPMEAMIKSSKAGMAKATHVPKTMHVTKATHVSTHRAEPASTEVPSLD